MAKANIYVRAPVWAATDRISIGGANVWAKTDTLAGGNVSVHSSNTLVLGNSSKFLTQLKAGDVIVANGQTDTGNKKANIWADARIVANVASNTKLNVITAFSVTDLANATIGNTIQKVDYFVVNTAYGWAKAQITNGTANTRGANVQVELQNMAANTFVVGDKIVFVHGNVRATRTVTGINGDTGNAKINVNANVNITAANAATVFKITEIITAINNLDTRIRTGA